MKLIVIALIGSLLLVSCASKPEASNPEASNPEAPKPEKTAPMTLEDMISEPYKADQTE